MWNYQKNLEFPIKITNPNPTMAKLVASQFGGANCNKLQSIVKKYR